jgi:adenosylcobinamide kinase / adenosylcobinamide-phosphate guanylyltransferase
LKKVILVTGPARSGKSEWAESLAMQSGSPVVYVATAMRNSNDKEWDGRIQLHQQRRPDHWQTLEVPLELSTTLAATNENSCLLVDSLGTWVANLLEMETVNWKNTVNRLIEIFQKRKSHVIFVAEETGWGVIPAYASGRTFRDRLGSLTRKIGVIADDVYLVTGGHALNLSILGTPIA